MKGFIEVVDSINKSKVLINVAHIHSVSNNRGKVNVNLPDSHSVVVAEEYELVISLIREALRE